MRIYWLHKPFNLSEANLQKRRVLDFWTPSKMCSTTRSFLEWWPKIELLSLNFPPGWWKWNTWCDRPAWQLWGNLCDQQKTVQLMWHLTILSRFAALSGGGVRAKRSSCIPACEHSCVRICRMRWGRWQRETLFYAKNDNDMVSAGVYVLTGIQCQRRAAVCVLEDGKT